MKDYEAGIGFIGLLILSIATGEYYNSGPIGFMILGGGIVIGVSISLLMRIFRSHS
jgi:hypothetical protein